MTNTVSSKRWILAAVGVGNLVSAIDGSVANTVLPVIAAEFHASIGVIEWVLMAYLVAMTSLLLSAGRLGDVAGHRRVFLAGFATFVAASAACGAAPTELVLIVFRAIQGSGAAMMSATGIVLVTQAFGPKERGKSIGLIVGIVYFGLAVGPALGGLLAGAFGWRAVFYINVPIGLAGLALGLRILPKGTSSQQQATFDVLGAAMSALGLTSLLIGLSQGQSWGWTSVPTLASIAAAVILLTLFVLLELRAEAPMLDLRLFRNRLLSAAMGSSVIFYAGVFFPSLLLPFYLLQQRHFPVSTAGLLLMVTPAAMMLLAPQAGKASDKLGSRLLSTAGVVFSAAGLVAVALLGPNSTIGQIVLAELILGLGSGIFSSPNISTIMGAVPRERQGTAAGIQAVARNSGMVLGIALAGAILSSRLAALGGQAHFIEAYRDTLIAGAAFMLSGALLSATRGPGPASRARSTPARIPSPGPTRTASAGEG